MRRREKFNNLKEKRVLSKILDQFLMHLPIGFDAKKNLSNNETFNKFEFSVLIYAYAFFFKYLHFKYFQQKSRQF